MALHRRFALYALALTRRQEFLQWRGGRYGRNRKVAHCSSRAGKWVVDIGGMHILVEATAAD